MKAFLSVIAVMIILAGCTQTPPVNNTPNNTDMHGCVAGTQWCQATQKCLSSSENCPVACPTDAKVCPDGSSVGRTGPNCEFAPCPQVQNNTTSVQMNQSEALSVARANGDCAAAGDISAIGTFNDNSKTWWFDITAIDKPGCNPACVVYENKSAEVNWRCTGLITYTMKTANTSLGEILVDGNGFTLYTFSSDSANKTTCTGGCASIWPPFTLTSDTIKVSSGVTGNVGVFSRAANTIQVTYNDMPLYRYSGDSKPGDTNGQGIGGKWFVVKAG